MKLQIGWPQFRYEKTSSFLHERVLRIAALRTAKTTNHLSMNFFKSITHLQSIIEVFIQSLSIEIYKFLNRFSPRIMRNVFKQNQPIPYELRHCNTFQSRRANSVKYSTETIPYIASTISSIFPEIIENSKSLELF